MSWTSPRTWAAGETETAAIFNSALRDNLNVIKTPIDNSGRIMLGIRGVYYGGSTTVGANSNAAGSGDTTLSTFTTTIPTGVFVNPGDGLLIDGIAFCAANTNSKSLKIKMDSLTPVTVFTNAANVANHNIPFQVYCLRSLNTSSGSIGVYGWSFTGAAHGGSPGTYPLNGTFGSPTYDIVHTLTFIGVGVAASDIVLADMQVVRLQSLTGAQL